MSGLIAIYLDKGTMRNNIGNYLGFYGIHSPKAPNANPPTSQAACCRSWNAQREISQENHTDLPAPELSRNQTDIISKPSSSIQVLQGKP